MDRLFGVEVEEDNLSCIADAYNPNLSELAKLVDVKYQILVFHVQNWDSNDYFVLTDCMIADILTKNLEQVKFAQMMELTNIG